MKRTLALLTAALMLFVLSSCALPFALEPVSPQYGEQEFTQDLVLLPDEDAVERGIPIRNMTRL